MAALIPLAEFCDPEVMHSYGVEREPEIFELLDVISKQLQVSIYNYSYYMLFGIFFCLILSRSILLAPFDQMKIENKEEFD